MFLFYPQILDDIKTGYQEVISISMNQAEYVNQENIDVFKMLQKIYDMYVNVKKSKPKFMSKEQFKLYAGYF